MNVITLVIIVSIIVILGLAYNTLVSRKNRIDEALGGISAYLKKRSDLIPNLVSTVSQFTTHESTLLKELTEMRTALNDGPQDNESLAQIDEKTSDALNRINVAVEAYPELTSSSNFVSLQQSLNEVEEQLSAARRNYNANVVRYNDAVRMLPTNLVAMVLRYQPVEVFKVTVEEAKKPDVSELFKAA